MTSLTWDRQGGHAHAYGRELISRNLAGQFPEPIQPGFGLGSAWFSSLPGGAVGAVVGSVHAVK